MSLGKLFFMGMESTANIPEKLRLPYDRGSLSQIRVVLDGMQARLGISDACCLALRLVLEELVTNSIMHGQPTADRDGSETGIHVDFHIEDQFLIFRYVDHGSPFDPRADLPRDAREDHLDDRPDGQLGWALILHYCDLLDYQRASGQNRMLLRFREEIPAAP